MDISGASWGWISLANLFVEVLRVLSSDSDRHTNEVMLQLSVGYTL